MKHLTNLPGVVNVETESDTYGSTTHQRVRLTFHNGYTASVIRFLGPHSPGMWEVAVLWGGALVYDTPVTDDVIGGLGAEQLPDVLKAIAALPART